MKTFPHVFDMGLSIVFVSKPIQGVSLMFKNQNLFPLAIVWVVLN